MNPIHSQSLHRNIIYHHDGTITLLGGNQEEAILDADGGLTTRTTNMQVSTLDGHVLQSGDVALQCAHCHTGPWSRKAIAACNACRRLVCINCAQQDNSMILCVVCLKAARHAAIKAWLWSIR